MNPFLGEDLGIPKRDIASGLPLRWWFHCFVCGEPQWEFLDWRAYLLSWKNTGPEIFINHLHDPNPLDKSFLPRTIKILKAHRADTLSGFVPFYLERLKEYKEILTEKIKIRKFRYYLTSPEIRYPILMRLLKQNRELTQAEKVRLEELGLIEKGKFLNV